MKKPTLLLIVAFFILYGCSNDHKNIEIKSVELVDVIEDADNVFGDNLTFSFADTIAILQIVFDAYYQEDFLHF